MSLLTVFLAAGLATVCFAQTGQAVPGLADGSISDYYRQLIGVVAGDWQKWGEIFTFLQSGWFWKVFLVIITAVPAIFFTHYMIVGAKHFDHDGPQVYFFTLFVRIVHFVAAVSVSLLILTGLIIIFGKYFGGGMPVRLARYVHLASAIVFVIPGVLMMLMWFREMLPQRHDISWIFILGGYLSKEKKPVPAAKFNAGQKMYFWVAAPGGLLMAYTGYVIWGMNISLDTVRIYTIVHNVLGMGIVAFYLTHVYMSVFAIAGSLQSMKTGYKPKEEVDILHSRYAYDESDVVAGH